jgi:hypothetical protein
MVYFSTAASRRSRGGTWSIIAPPFRLMRAKFGMGKSFLILAIG